LNRWKKSGEAFDKLSAREKKDGNFRVFWWFGVPGVALGSIPDFYHISAVYWTTQVIALILLVCAILCMNYYHYYRGYDDAVRSNTETS
jgi:hypothetical protein